jgi:hypothetical protein
MMMTDGGLATSGLATVVSVSAVRFSPAGSRVMIKRRARTGQKNYTHKTYKTDCWTFWLAGFDASVDHMKLGDLQASSVLKHEIRRMALASPGARVKFAGMTGSVKVNLAALPFRRQVMVHRRAWLGLADFVDRHPACDAQDCLEFATWASTRGANLSGATDEDILQFATRKRALAEQAEARGLRVCPTDPLALEPAVKPSTWNAQCSVSIKR